MSDFVAAQKFIAGEKLNNRVRLLAVLTEPCKSYAVALLLAAFGIRAQ